MKIFILNLNNLNLELSNLDEETQNKINKFIFLKDKKIAYGSHLIKLELLRHLNISNQMVTLKTNIYGKPYFEDNNKKIINFNISHDKNYVVLFYNYNQFVGVDIIKINKNKQNLNTLNKIFSDEDNKLINKNIKFFFRIWAFKEAYLKYLGCGINNNISKISYSKVKKKIFNYALNYSSNNIIYKIDIINCFTFNNKNFIELEIDNEYILTLCSKNINNNKIEIINLN